VLRFVHAACDYSQGFLYAQTGSRGHAHAWREAARGRWLVLLFKGPTAEFQV
jgi:hypothetical protein